MLTILASCLLLALAHAEQNSLLAKNVLNYHQPQLTHRVNHLEPEPHYNYRPYHEIPSHIQHLLHAQQSIGPLVPIPSQPPLDFTQHHQHRPTQIVIQPPIQNHQNLHPHDQQPHHHQQQHQQHQQLFKPQQTQILFNDLPKQPDYKNIQAGAKLVPHTPNYKTNYHQEPLLTKQLNNQPSHHQNSINGHVPQGGGCW